MGNQCCNCIGEKDSDHEEKGVEDRGDFVLLTDDWFHIEELSGSSIETLDIGGVGGVEMSLEKKESEKTKVSLP